MMKKWYKAKILIFIVVTLIVLVVSYDFIDPPHLTKNIETATVKRSVQMFPRYGDTYHKIVVELTNGQLYTFSTQLSSGIKPGAKVDLKVYKRKITGLVTYKLK